MVGLRQAARPQVGADTHTQSDCYGHAETYAHADSHTYAYKYGYANSNGDAGSDIYRDFDAHSHPYGDTNSNPHGYADSYARANRYTNIDARADSHALCCCSYGNSGTASADSNAVRRICDGYSADEHACTYRDTCFAAPVGRGLRAFGNSAVRRCLCQYVDTGRALIHFGMR